MKRDITQERCSHCSKNFERIIKPIITKMDDKRNTYYTCPYCDAVCGTILLAGNEEVLTRAIPEYVEKH